MLFFSTGLPCCPHSSIFTWYGTNGLAFYFPALGEATNPIPGVHNRWICQSIKINTNRNQLITIGDFRVAFRLCFKVSPSAKPFIWKLVLITCIWTKKCVWIKLISMWKASHQDSLWNRGERQLENHLLTNWYWKSMSNRWHRILWLFIDFHQFLKQK